MGSSLFDEYGFVTEVDSETLGFVVPDHGTDSLAGVTEGLQAMAVGSVDGGNGGNGAQSSAHAPAHMQPHMSMYMSLHARWAI